MRTGSPMAELSVSAEERATLEGWVRGGAVRRRLWRCGPGSCWIAPAE